MGVMYLMEPGGMLKLLELVTSTASDVTVDLQHLAKPKSLF